MDRRWNTAALFNPAYEQPTAKLHAEQLEARDVPSTTLMEDTTPTVTPTASMITAPAQARTPRQPLIEQPRERYVVGTNGGGSAQVNVHDASTGTIIGIITPFGNSYSGGVSVATGDVTGDGIKDIIVGAGQGRQPTVKVFDGKTLHEVRSFNAYSETFTGGLSVAAGDVNGDGRADIITGAGAGSMAHVKVFSGRDVMSTILGAPRTIRNEIAFESSFRGGINVAAGDLNNDGRAEVAVAKATGGGDVKVYDGRTNATLLDLKPYGTAHTGGVSVSIADVDGNGMADIVSSSPSGTSTVKVFSSTGTEIASYSAFSTPVGARVFARDLNGDGKAEIMVSAGSGRPEVRVLQGMTGSIIRSFPAVMPRYTSGLNLG
jgi:hypothetical protein